MKNLLKIPKRILLYAIKIPKKIVTTNYLKLAIKFKNMSIYYLAFCVLLFSYMSYKVIQWISSFRITPKFFKNKITPASYRTFQKISNLSNHKEATINRVNLIDLAIKNMLFKRARAVITIGGMSVGIGAIVFLVSLGYGLQRVVIGRVASLKEIKQIDIGTQVGSNNRITDKTIADVDGFEGVSKTLPLISVVGRVNFQNSVTDAAVFGVTSEYLTETATSLSEGKFFDSNEISKIEEPKYIAEEEQGTVAGVSTIANLKEGDVIGKVDYSIEPSVWLKVRSAPSTTSEIIGYTRRVEGLQSGDEVLGRSYSGNENGEVFEDELGNKFGKWINSKVFVWNMADCVEPESCEDGKYTKYLNDSGVQNQIEGFIAEIGLAEINTYKVDTTDVLGITAVLQESTESASLREATESASASTSNVVQLEEGFVEIASESANLAAVEVKKVEVAPNAQKKAVLNRAMVNVLGLSEQEAIGKVVKVSFVVTADLLEDQQEKVESVEADYEIIGIVADDDVPFFYVPFIDLRGLGIVNYSQLKVVVDDDKYVDTVRKQIEGLGFSTSSVKDTIDQIDRLFATARLALASIGLVALSVAALGMFNTMSVSLLERTREVGLMKAMGMRSYEVKELFLTESMVMGFFGGVLGIFLGLCGGILVSIVLSALSVVKGVGLINISYLPIGFILFIIFLSIVVGLVTGIYPARRATKISALNALRYE